MDQIKKKLIRAIDGVDYAVKQKYSSDMVTAQLYNTFYFLDMYRKQLDNKKYNYDTEMNYLMDQYKFAKLLKLKDKIKNVMNKIKYNRKNYNVSNVKKIQKHAKGFLTRKLLKNLKTRENLININKLPRGNIVRIRRAPGLYNYVAKNTLKKYII